MKRISVYIISLFFCTLVNGQFSKGNEDPDTIIFPLKIKAGIELTGPVIWFTGREVLATEGYLTYDLNERRAIYVGGGYARFSYSDYNYKYLADGIFAKTGIDFNILKPQVSRGKYWGGVGLRYGISTFEHETPWMKQENYWGMVESSIAPERRWAHFLEVSPGFRAEVLGNISIGWSVSLRRLIWSGNKDMRPVYIPGYGNAGNKTGFGLNYFITMNFTWKKIKVYLKPEVEDEPEEEEIQTVSSPASY